MKQEYIFYVSHKMYLHCVAYIRGHSVFCHPSNSVFEYIGVYVFVLSNCLCLFVNLLNVSKIEIHKC